MNDILINCPCCGGKFQIMSNCCGARIDTDILICSDCKEHSDLSVCETCNGNGFIKLNVTPGNWKANKVNTTEWEIVSDHLTTSGLLQLANVRNGDDFGSIEKMACEAEANAKLISASKDMLSALLKVEAFFERNNPPYPVRNNDVIDSIKQSIKKALEGKTI